jgi:molecular chaperone HtpG
MTPHWSKTIPFRVDIAGIIDIMGSSLYSRADTPVRELIQNAHDGILRRRSVDLRHHGRIDIETRPETKQIVFHDDGIGLSAEEAEKYLGTLGIGVTGLIKRRLLDEEDDGPAMGGDGGSLIGQFGVGLFSAFLLAEKITVESRRMDGHEGIRWTAGPGTDIELAWSPREDVGTSVILDLKPDFVRFATQTEPLEAAIREFADFLPVPIHLNGAKSRVNVINVPWFDTTPDDEQLELELEGYFSETPLDIIPIRIERPVPIAGALYVSPERTPGFTSDATVAVTVRRMVISRNIRGLLPPWASFLRGVLELQGCAPTASREDLVRDSRFHQVRQTLEDLIFSHLEQVARDDTPKLQSLIAWHRYSLAGAALSQPRLRDLLRTAYRFPTSQGPLSFQEILDKSEADPLFESEADAVIWYNVDRRQERWTNQVFARHPAPCVQALLSFEESLLAAFSADRGGEGQQVDLRVASPTAPGFAEQVLGIADLQDASPDWQAFLDPTGARILVGEFDAAQPVLAFLNERRELQSTFEELRKEGSIPAGFQRLIDNHFSKEQPKRNEVVLNGRHRLVARALAQSTRHPLASVLRLLVLNALQQAGAVTARTNQDLQADDLDWIADALWGKKE